MESYQHVYRSLLSVSNQLEAGNLDENSLDHIITRVDFYREAVTRFANNQNLANINIDRVSGLLGEVVRILESELHRRYPTEDAETHFWKQCEYNVHGTSNLAFSLPSTPLLAPFSILSQPRAVTHQRLSAQNRKTETM